MRKINTNRVGEKHVNNQGLGFEIIDYIDCANVTIRYSDGFIAHNVQYTHIKSKSVSNPYHKSVYGIGFMGEGIYKSKIDNKNTRIYSVWHNVFGRCYDVKVQEKHPSYIGCSVAKEWHNFQNFAKWFEENYNPETMDDWHLDKDILIKGNKIYSPDTCCFVPNKINGMLKSPSLRNNTGMIGVHYDKNFDKYETWLPKNKKGRRTFNTH